MAKMEQYNYYKNNNPHNSISDAKVFRQRKGVKYVEFLVVQQVLELQHPSDCRMLIRMYFDNSYFMFIQQR